MNDNRKGNIALQPHLTYTLVLQKAHIAFQLHWTSERVSTLSNGTNKNVGIIGCSLSDLSRHCSTTFVGYGDRLLHVVSYRMKRLLVGSPSSRHGFLQEKNPSNINLTFDSASSILVLLFIDIFSDITAYGIKFLISNSANIRGKYHTAKSLTPISYLSY